MRISKIAVASGLFATAMMLGVGVASADAGAPGATYPEQPGTNNATGCANVGAHIGTASANESGVAAAIGAGLFSDACG
jgi:hypothetical protein